jgi:GMC oxidoreductase
VRCKAIFKHLRATAYRLFAFDSGGALAKPPGFFGAGHIMGTTRMGKEGEHRAVDAQRRSVDHPNLYVVGSSVFVTGAIANPTMTIAALHCVPRMRSRLNSVAASFLQGFKRPSELRELSRVAIVLCPRAGPPT